MVESILETKILSMIILLVDAVAMVGTRSAQHVQASVQRLVFLSVLVNFMPGEQYGTN